MYPLISKILIYWKSTKPTEIENLKLQNFTSYIGLFFENPDEYDAINMVGEDISAEYYDNNIAYYKAGDYRTLMKNTEGLVSSFDCFTNENKNKQTSEIVPYSTVTRSAAKNFACMYTKIASYNEATVRVSGSYQVDLANSIITSASQPTVTLIDYPHGDLEIITMSVISRGCDIQSSQSSVIFSTVVDLYSHTGDNVLYYGRYAMSTTGNSSGLVSFTPSNGYVFPN